MPPSQWIAPATYYLTADQTEAVPEGDPRARYLLVHAGGTILWATAQHYGLVADPAAKAVTFPPANKMVPGPRRTKGR